MSDGTGDHFEIDDRPSQSLIVARLKSFPDLQVIRDFKEQLRLLAQSYHRRAQSFDIISDAGTFTLPQDALAETFDMKDTFAVYGLQRLVVVAPTALVTRQVKRMPESPVETHIVSTLEEAYALLNAQP